MNRYFKLLLLLVIVLFQTQVQAAGIAWHRYSNQVFADAKRNHKLVLIYGKAAWCPYCQRMNGTFATDEITKMVNATFIPVMVDVDESPQISAQYNISTLPTLIILDGDKNIKDTLIGYADPARLADQLKGYAGH